MSTEIFTEGMHIANYELQLLVGWGAQAEVWKARDIYSREECALRLNYIASSKQDSREYLAWQTKLQIETTTWKKFVRSLFVVHLHAYFKVPSLEVDGTKYDVFCQKMEYLPYGDMQKYAVGNQRQKFLKVMEDGEGIIPFMRKLASSLEVGHSAKCVHGDFKLKNILLHKERELYPKLMDFGVSFNVNEQPGIVGFVGTPEYAPLDILERGTQPNFISDIYALGVVYFEILTGMRYVSGTESLASDERIKTVIEYLKLDKKMSEEQLSQEFGMDINQKKHIVGLVNEMLLNSTNQSISLERVLQSLELPNTTRTRNSLTTISGTVRPNRYRWHKDVHAHFKETLVFYAVISDKPFTDQKKLVEKLEENGVRGFSVFRLIGTYDFMLRVWITSKNKDIIKNCLQEHADDRGANFQISIINIKDFSIFGEKEYELGQLDNLEHIINECRDQDSDQELKNLMNKKLVASELGRQKVSKNAIRVFFFILCYRDKLDIATSETLKQKCKTIIFEHASTKGSGIKQVSYYECKVNPQEFSNRSASKQCGMMFRLMISNFHDLQKLILIFGQKAQELRQIINSPITTSSLLDLDREPLRESDDGSILFESSTSWE